MQTSELKFLLKLLGQPNYRATLPDLYRNEKTPAAERNRTCRSLAERELVAYSWVVERFKITPAGQALLQIEQAPLSDIQRRILKACAAKSTVPSAIRHSDTMERQTIIQDLAAKGYIRIEKSRIETVWLTDQGCDFLQYDCQPSGNSTISLNLLRNYLNFLRKAPAPAVSGSQGSNTDRIAESESGVVTDVTSEPPSDQQILEQIQQLDRREQSRNYLPIFHLRDYFQPVLSREELDQALYRLQRQDQIELSLLQNPEHYKPEQTEAGIRETTGGLLFFISLL